MASGAFNGGGSVGGSYLRLEWQSYANQAGNYSDVHAQLYLVLQGGTSIVATEVGDINIDGQAFGFSRGTTSRGPNGTYHLHSASRRIYHNGDGSKHIQLGGYFRSGWTTFGTINVGMYGAWLDQINRYININSWSLGNMTVGSINVSLNTSGTADLVDYQVNDGAWTRGYTGNFTSNTFTIPNLLPATTYSVRIRVRNANGGLYTTSGLKSATTSAVTITSASLTGISDTSLSLVLSASHQADRFEYRVNGGSWNVISGDFTSNASTVISGLTSNTSYTVDVRARHKTSQTYTPIVTRTATTANPTALQPTQLSPANGEARGTLEPTLSWQYNATSADAQSAYQILVYPEASTTAIWDSGKVGSSNTSAIIPASAGLAFNQNYQWKVRTWSSSDVVGPYSELVLFKTSQPPVVVITDPTDLEVINTDAPTLAWTYTDPEGTPQTSFTITIKEINTTGETEGATVLTQTVSNSDATSYTIQTGNLSNNSLYIVRVSATDSDGIVGLSDWNEFEVSFIAPAEPNIDVEVSEDKLFTRITVGDNTPANDAFDTDRFRIYKREVGQTDWSYIGQVIANRNYIDSFESVDGWANTGVGQAVALNAMSKQGESSLELATSGAGTATFTKATAGVGSIASYDKIRVWVFTADASDVTSITFRFGTDASNYYSFVVNSAQLADGRWTSIETDFNSLSITGSPTFGNIDWTQMVVVASATIAPNELLVDSWNLALIQSDTFVYDYVLANNARYEYAATAVNDRENLESDKALDDEIITIIYNDLQNAFLVPIGNETNSITGHMDGGVAPSWQTTTATEYYHPVGARNPVVYTLPHQQTRSGQAEIRFYDSEFGGEGLDGVKQLVEIMNNKPILFRTWWGDNIYISIDGRISPQRKPGIGWYAIFNYTEIGE